MPDGFTMMLQDQLINLVSGLGTAKSKAEGGFFTRMAGMSRSETDALYRQSALAGKVVDLPAEDMIREWRQWNAPKASIEAIEAAEQQFGVQEKIGRAWKMASKDGGALIVMGTGDDPELPLNPATVPRGGLKYLHVVNRWDVSIEELDRDPMSPWFQQPLFYRMVAPDGQYVRIHPSRTICVVNTPRLDVLASGEPWGDSIYERLRTVIRDATAAFQACASIMQEAKLDVVSIPNLTVNVQNPQFRDAVITRFGLANTLKSINNALLLDTNETWEQKTATFAGFPEIIDRLLLMVASAADIPVTRLLGRSPAGLNATGEADLETYYTMIRSRQQTVLKPMIAPLDTILIRHALGRMPRGIYFDWRPLWSLGGQDQSEINRKHAEAVKAYAETGLFKREALAKAAINQMQDDGFLGSLGELGEAAVAPEGEVQQPNQPQMSASSRKNSANTED